MNIEQARFNMIEQQIRPWNVLDPAVLALLGSVKREDFVPPAHHALAFFDTEVPLGHGEHMLSPKLEARLLQELRLQRHERVLEIGTGSGFMAALLSHRARQVVTLEINPTLAAAAAENLRRAGISNVSVLGADGAKRLPAAGPFDAIVLSGSVAAVPQDLLNELKIGGRLIALVGQEPIMRGTLIKRLSEHRFDSTDLFDAVAPRLHGFDEPSRFAF